MADPYVLVISASNPNYSNLEEFVEYAKANPGVVKMADSGVVPCKCSRKSPKNLLN